MGVGEGQEEEQSWRDSDMLNWMMTGNRGLSMLQGHAKCWHKFLVIDYLQFTDSTNLRNKVWFSFYIQW